MKWKALVNKPGAYEIRQNNQNVCGGIFINAKNRGIGFVGDASQNRYIFEFEDGMFNKQVKIFLNTLKNQIGKIELGFSDSGALDLEDRIYNWQEISSSKVWVDSKKDIVVLFDLENNADSEPNVLFAPDLEPETGILLSLCGWFLLVVEWRAGLTNPNLAGMPVKLDSLNSEIEGDKVNNSQQNWFDFLIESVDLMKD